MNLKNIIKLFPDNVVVMSYIVVFVNLIYSEGTLQIINGMWLFFAIMIFINYKFNEVRFGNVR